MISSSIQVILFSAFGILFPIIIWALNKLSAPEPAPSISLLRKLQSFSLKTSGFVIVSFLITAFTTSSQVSNLSILERTFISSLVDFQLWCILGLILCSNADHSLNKTRVSWELLMYYYILFFAQMATSSTSKIPDKDVYSLLAKECHKQHQFINVISSGVDGGDKLKWMSVGGGIGICFILFVIFGSAHVPAVLATPFKIMWRNIPAWVKRHADIVSHFVMVLGYAGTIPLNLYRLNRIRNLVLQTSQSVEESWGYGQTTAVLLWFPFLFYAVKETISTHSI
jgi:hypothetical protein